MTQNTSVQGMLVMGLLMWKRHLHCRRDLAVGLAQGASVRVIADGEGFCRLPPEYPDAELAMTRSSTSAHSALDSARA